MLGEFKLWTSSLRYRRSNHFATTIALSFVFVFFSVDRINFPSLLPTGALLGCVDVVDCLGQEEYRQQFPAGDSDSPFVFVCTNPQELLVKFPMTGNHKICELN